MLLWNKIFKYEDGILYWVTSVGAAKCGKSISSKGSHGYFRVQYQGIRYLVHRIIWELHYGEIPEGMEIDHINRIKTDNRIENLRVVTSSQNKHNIGALKTSKTGIRGVSPQKNGGFMAKFMHNGKQNCKWFKTLEEAIQQRKEWEVINNVW